MNNLESEQGHALLLLGPDVQFADDVHRMASALDLAKLSGQEVILDRFWVSDISDQPVIVQPTEGSRVKAGILTESGAMTAADIELSRHESLPTTLLSPRERNMKVRFDALRDDVSPETLRAGFADTLQLLGAVAVIAGANSSLHAASSYYDDLRQLWRS